MRLGIDIGGTSAKVAVWSQGRWLRTGQSASYDQPTLSQIRAAIQTAAGPIANLQSVGLCLPGTFDAATRTLTHSVNIPALVGLPVDQLLTDVLPLPASIAPLVCSDALAAARDIYAARQLTGRLVALSLGTGVGCGVLDGTGALDVDEGSPGHFGQLDVSIAGHDVLGPDGGAGSLEGYLGAPALERAYGGSLPEITARLIPDAPALQALARALRIAHALYRPHHLCLCGGIGLGLRHLLPAIHRAVATNLTRIARPQWTLTCGDDLFHAARGAARLAGAGSG